MPGRGRNQTPLYLQAQPMVAQDEESDKIENERRESDSDIHRPRDKGARIQAHIHRQRAGGGDGIGAVTQWRADGGCVGEKRIK